LSFTLMPKFRLMKSGSTKCADIQHYQRNDCSQGRRKRRSTNVARRAISFLDCLFFRDTKSDGRHSPGFRQSRAVLARLTLTALSSFQSSSGNGNAGTEFRVPRAPQVPRLVQPANGPHRLTSAAPPASGVYVKLNISIDASRNQMVADWVETSRARENALV